MQEKKVVKMKEAEKHQNLVLQSFEWSTTAFRSAQSPLLRATLRAKYHRVWRVSLGRMYFLMRYWEEVAIGLKALRLEPVQLAMILTRLEGMLGP